MKDKINVAELLRYCPSGMELDCSMWDNLYFDRVEDDLIHCYYVLDGYRNATMFLKDGCYTAHKVSKCVIFPKGKNSWEGFVPPCEFKDGDIIFTHTNASKGLLENSWVSIFKEYRNNRCACYVCLCLSDLELYHDKWEDELLCELCEIEDSRIATEEEKAKLFDVIMAIGYHWNGETKTLEKLIKPKFKVGDRIRSVISSSYYTIVDIEDDQYVIKPDAPEKLPYHIDFSLETNYELVPKFDITTLKPFESKVLVRDSNVEKWRPATWGYCDIDKEYNYPYEVVGGHGFSMCIPYEGNEHLLGKTDDCSSFYKTWE